MELPAEVEKARFNRMWAVWVALAFVAGAIAVRCAILFSRVLPPGIDAAYYPMQARGLIENGKLPYVEVPLIFWIDAAVARVFMATRGMNVDDATLLASRLVDAVCQPLTALPLLLLVFVFASAIVSGLRERGDAVPSASRVSAALAVSVFLACAIAVLSPPILRMTGDFQKNSLGFVWMAGAAWAAAGALTRGGVRRYALLGGFLALASITHIGAFGVTLVLVAAAVGVYVMRTQNLRAGSIGLLGLGAVLAAGVLWLLMYTVAPSKAVSLVQGVHKMFTVGDRPQGRPLMEVGPGANTARPNAPIRPRGEFRNGPAGTDRPGAAFGGGEREGGPGNERARPQGPPGGFSSSALPLRFGAWAALIALGGFAVWRARLVEPATQAVLAGAAFAAVFITCPLIQGQYAERLALMTPIPLAIIVSFVVLEWSLSARAIIRRGALVAGAAVGCGIVAAALPQALRATGGPPRMNDGQFAGRQPVPFSQEGPGGGPRGGQMGAPNGGGGGAVVADDAVEEFRSMRGLVPTDGTSVVLARHGLQWWAGYFLKTPVREERATAEQLEKYERVFVLSEKRGQRGMNGPSGAQNGRGGSGAVAIPSGATPVFEGEHYRLFEVPKPGPASRGPA